MSVYTKPELNAIFDSNDFKTGTDILSKEDSDTRYLHYPIAQGDETFQNLIITGSNSLEAQTLTKSRIKQTLVNNSNWSNVNGYYALDENTTNLPNPSSSGVKAVSNWYAKNNVTNNHTFMSVCWSPNLNIYCAVADGGAGGRIETSQDGMVWVDRTASANNAWQSICWAEEIGIFCAVSKTGSAGTRVMTSQNGVTWVSRTEASLNDWNSICWSPELRLFVAVAGTGTGDQIMTSPNGVIWTSRNSGVADDWRCITWSPELSLFVALSHNVNGYVLTSSDGITWTRSLSSPLAEYNSVCWSSQLGLFVAVGNGPSVYVVTSVDGFNWITRTAAANNQWTSVCWSSQLGLFCACSQNGTDRVMYSINGINWVSVNLSTRGFQSICYSPELGLFAIVANTGTTRVFISDPKGRLPTNSNVFNSNFNNIDSSGNWSLKLLDASSNDSNMIIGSTFGNTIIQSEASSNINLNNFAIFNNNISLPIPANFVTPINSNLLGYTITNTSTIIDASSATVYNPQAFTLEAGVWLYFITNEVYKSASNANNTKVTQIISNITVTAGSLTGGYSFRNNYGVDNTTGWTFPVATTQRISNSGSRFARFNSTTTLYNNIRVIFSPTTDKISITGNMTAIRIA